jgi:signal transduction histidine kinase
MRCNNIIDALLEYTDKRELKLSFMEIDSWLKDHLSREDLPDGIEIKCNFNANRSYSFDRVHFGQAINNLITNSIHALQDEDSLGNTISIETLIQNDVLKIIIKDDGAGMPAEISDKICEPLFSTKTFGVGLGMPIAKSIVEDHGGTVDIQSEEAKGTTVILNLPLSSVQNN